MLVLQVEKTGGVDPMRETMAKGSELPGHEGKRKGRHCISTGRGAARSEGSVLLRLRVARSPPAALCGEMPAALHGQCNAMHALKTSQPSMFAAGDFKHFLCYTREEGQPIPCSTEQQMWAHPNAT